MRAREKHRTIFLSEPTKEGKLVLARTRIMALLVGSALGLPMERSMRSSLSPAKKNAMVLSPSQELDYNYWNQLTSDDRGVPLKPLLPAELLQKASIDYNPKNYPGTACRDWCKGKVKIDRAPAEAAGRTHFPAGDVADWAEKCSWDDYCAGCAECSDPLNTCVNMCDVIADPEATPPWKQETRTYAELCEPHVLFRSGPLS